MKKNILLVQSLLVLPLMTSSIIFCSEKPTFAELQVQNQKNKETQLKSSKKELTYTQKEESGSQKNRRERRQLKKQPQQLEMPKLEVVSLEEDTIETRIPSVEEFDAIAQSPVKIMTPAEQEARQWRNYAEGRAQVAPLKYVLDAIKVLPENKELHPVKKAAVETEIHVTIDPLSASVYNPAPAVKQGLGWSEWIKSTVSSKWFALDAIQSKTFDPENVDHMKGLMTAAEKLVLSGDSKGLKNLLDACRANYPNIELKKKVAIQIQERFKIDEDTVIEEYKKNIALENETLMITQKAVLDKTAELITRLTKQLENNSAELAKAQIDYDFATRKIMEAHNKKAKDARDGNNVLYKLRRDICNYPAAPFSSEYLNTIKTIDATHQNSNDCFENLNKVNDTIKTTLSLLAAPEKTTILQIDNK